MGLLQQNPYNKTMRLLFSSQYLYLLLTGMISTILLLVTYNVYWWPQDDGIFAYLAEAVLNGGIYGLEVIDIHGGYHTLLNAWLFQVFGSDVVVLRYPLVVMGILQALMVAHMVSKSSSQSVATLAGISTVTLGFIQFPNASPGWYLLFFAIAVVWVLATFKKNGLQLAAVGVLIGLGFLFRHPSAAFISMGVFLYLLQEAEIGTQHFRIFSLPRIVLCFLLAGVLAYSYLLFEVLAFLLFAAPLLIVIWHKIRVVPDWNLRELIVNIACISGGFVLAITPMLLYQMRVGDVYLWVMNSFFSSANILNYGFFFEAKYLDYLQSEFFYYWLSILILPFFLIGLWAQRKLSNKKIHPAVFIALGFGLVSFYYQIPFYFYCSISVFVLAVFVSIDPWREAINTVAISFLLIINILAISTQSIGFQSILQADQFVDSEIPKVSLKLERASQQDYLKLISIIEENSSNSDSMFVFPLNPDLYFVTERANPFPFYGTSFAITNEIQYQSLLERLTVDPPRLFVFNRGSKYVQAYEEQLFEALKTDKRYQLLEKYKSYWFFTLSGA